MRLSILLFAALLWGCAPESPPPPAAPAATPAAMPALAGPMVTGAWVRPVPATARMTAGYLDVHNPGPEALVIVGAESPLFGSIELHGTVMVDGMARMRHQETVTVAPGETVRFEPGGLHLMLMQAVETVPSSGAIPISLLLADGQRLEFLAPVGQPGG
jgi:periplasmic copper chaperone A